MFTITNRVKRITQILMSIGVISLIIAFYSSTNGIYSDKEIGNGMVEIVSTEFNDILPEVNEVDISYRLLELFYKVSESEEDKQEEQQIAETIIAELEKEFYITIGAEQDYLEISLEEYINKYFQDLSIWQYKTIAKDSLNPELIHKICRVVESKFNMHFSESEIHHLGSLQDIEDHTEHYFHTKLTSPWSALLFNNYFFLGIAVFAVFFVALQYVSEAGWSIVLKRIPESVISFLPIAGIIMLIIMIAGAMHWHHIYHWMADGVMDPNSEDYDKIIAGKEPFLNIPFFLIRSVIYILGWVYFGRKLKELSLSEDRHGGLSYYKKSIKSSAWFIVFFAVTSSVASWDWIMSIDTHWFSTIFGWYIFSEWATIGFASILLITLYLKRKGYLEHVNDSHIHDLGKWVFAFSLVWTYMWFSQFMLIWYANIPEEVTYFTARLEVSNYRFLFWFSMIINFIVPLLLLMSRDSKRHNSRLIFVSIVILVGHWINSYLLIAPGSLNTHGHIGFIEIGIGLGFLGLFVYVVLNALSKSPLEAKNHPFLDESKHLNT